MAERADLEASAIGTVAAEVLRQSQTVEVIAAFERSFYLLCDEGIVVVCADELGRGPLAMTVPEAPASWRDLVHVGMKGRVAPQRLVLDSGLGVSIARAVAWTPPPFPAWPCLHLAANLAAFAPLAAAACPNDGLAALVHAPQRKLTRTGAAARDTLATLRAALPTCLDAGAWTPEAIGAATLLVGLGPGTTPSGDDLLGGLMLALTARGMDGLRDALWDHLVDELDDLTVPISAMHLSAAADGMGAEALHRAMLALYGATCDPNGIATDLASLGATSGWDAFAGFVMGVTA